MIIVSCRREVCTTGLTCSKVAEQVSLTKKNQVVRSHQPLKEIINNKRAESLQQKGDEVANQEQSSHGSAYGRYRAKWVPKQLKEQHRRKHLVTCNRLMSRYHKGDAFLHRKTCIYHYKQENKRQSYGMETLYMPCQ
jgi:hypothetical protein